MLRGTGRAIPIKDVGSFRAEVDKSDMRVEDFVNSTRPSLVTITDGGVVTVYGSDGTISMPIQEVFVFWAATPTEGD